MKSRLFVLGMIFVLSASGSTAAETGLKDLLPGHTTTDAESRLRREAKGKSPITKNDTAQLYVTCTDTYNTYSQGDGGYEACMKNNRLKDGSHENGNSGNGMGVKLGGEKRPPTSGE